MKRLIWFNFGLFKGRNARAAALKWASGKYGRTAYFNHGAKIFSTNGREICEGWTDGSDQSGCWWSAKLSVRERMSKM